MSYFELVQEYALTMLASYGIDDVRIGSHHSPMYFRDEHYVTFPHQAGPVVVTIDPQGSKRMRPPEEDAMVITEAVLEYLTK